MVKILTKDQVQSK